MIDFILLILGITLLFIIILDDNPEPRDF